MSEESPFFRNLEVLEDQHWITRRLKGRGELEFAGHLRFGGEWTGSMRSTEEGACLVVLPGARIRGTLEAQEILIEGLVEDADIRAESVRLLPGARVQGRVQAKRLVVEPGALLEGRVAAVRDTQAK